MSVLHLDFETHSAVDLKKTGSHVYFADPTTDVWCCAYAFDDAPVQIWTPDQPCPPEIADHILDGGLLAAWNAAFEKVAIERVLGPRYHWPIPATEQWRCVMVQAMAMALPAALENAAPAAGLDIRKDDAGKRLMLQMARPRKRDPLTWWNEPEKLARLYEYCKQDVVVEREIEKRLRPLKESELALWHLDLKINARGVHVDEDLCQAAKKIVARVEDAYDRRMLDLTEQSVTACSNRNQLVAWLRANGLDDVESVAKDQIEEILARKDLKPVVREVLELRRASAKASVAKIDALLNGMDADGGARGLLQFHAASTGRWAGRRFQPQNIKRPNMDLDGVNRAIPIIRSGDYDLMTAIYDEPLDVVGDCIRGMVRARDGHRIVAADYSNIEGRVLAWLAGEHWKLDAFRAYDRGEGPDLYKVTAAGILGKVVEDITKSERQAYGKVPELACGYQGGLGAFQTMAVNYGVDLPDQQVTAIVKAWREKHPRIRQFWYDLEAAAMVAVACPGNVQRVGPLRLKKAGSFLLMRLPSGRFLSYAYPRMVWKDMPWLNEETGKPARKEVLGYMGVNSYTRKWELCYAYGGLLAENATQAVARDVMADGMPRIEAAGYPIIMTVHDELVTEPRIGHGSLEELCELMVPTAEWATGLPVSVAGFEAERYGKGE